jgi:hypothetical protein
MLIAAFTSLFCEIEASASQSVLTLEPGSGHVISVRVNGRALNLRVDPGADQAIVLNPDAARRAGLRPSIVPLTAIVGSVNVRGRWTRSRLEVAGASSRARFIWFPDYSIAGADGLISPVLLPYARTELILRGPLAGERTAAVPVRNGPYGLHHALILGSIEVSFRFRLEEERSTATAAAGALVAAHHDGRWTGEAFAHPVRLGVERPVRPLQLARQLDFVGFRVATVLVRTGDSRGDHQLPSADSSEDIGESTVVVTGRARRQPPLYSVLIGRDQLTRCSRIAYAKAEQQLSLTCAE